MQGKPTKTETIFSHYVRWTFLISLKRERFSKQQYAFVLIIMQDRAINTSLHILKNERLILLLHFICYDTYSPSWLQTKMEKRDYQLFLATKMEYAMDAWPTRLIFVLLPARMWHILSAFNSRNYRMECIWFLPAVALFIFFLFDCIPPMNHQWPFLKSWFANFDKADTPNFRVERLYWTFS